MLQLSFLFVCFLGLYNKLSGLRRLKFIILGEQKPR